MLKQLFPLTILMLFAIQSFAQKPTPIRKAIDPDLPESVVCLPGSQNQAGTITIDPATHVGSSNDVAGDPIYLCEDDLFEIDHNAGTENLTGDPIPGTMPGVGYIFYTCPPSTAFDGDLSTIENDPCALIQFGQITVFAGFDTSGDVEFVNNGGLQDFFNGGDPVQFWFAPITYDQYDAASGQAVYEGTPTGPCVDVNHDELFSVVYLNTIEGSNIQTTLNGSSCQGSFLIEGGLPEFDSNETYDITIALTSDPSQEAKITNGTPFHGDVVEFEVIVPGEYTVTVTDGKGCPSSFPIDMTGCNAIVMNIPDVTGLPGTEVCLPITVENFNNILSFQYSLNWDPTIIEWSTNNFNALAPPNLDINTLNAASGLMTVSFFDLTLAAVTLNDGDAIFEVCFNIIGPNGSSSPVTINTDPNAPTPVDVFDGNSVYLGLVPNNGSVTAIVSADFDIAIVHTDITCNGADDGAFTATVNGSGGGIAPYSLTWTNTTTGATGTTNNIGNNGVVNETGLTAGDYSVVVTDSSVPPESEITDFTIIDPGVLVVNISAVPPACNGGTDGTLTAQVSLGGVIVSDLTGYNFAWSPGGNNTDVVTDYIPGQVYTVNVVSPNLCLAMDTGSGTTPAPLDINFAKVDASCAGVDNGSATAIPSGGVAGTSYNFAWSNGAGNVAMISNLAPGTYTCTITDDNMCTFEKEVLIGASTIVNAIGTAQDVQCFGANNGSITMMPTVTGTNNGPFTYTWSSNIPASNTTATANGLLADFYSVTVSDPVGCVDTTSFTIIEPTEIMVSVDVTHETCMGGGSDGTATATVTGGTLAAGSDYTFNWNCCISETTNMATGITAGTYTVIVLDDNNCSQPATFTINPPTPPSNIMFDSVSVACPNSTNGELTANFMAGNGTNHTFAWSNSGTTQTITGLGPGTYTVTITDEFSCAATAEATLWAPTLLSVTPVPTNPSCFGLNDGIATVQVTGSTTPYSYQWSANAGGSTQPLVPALLAGTYTVTVSDDNNCEQVAVEVVLQDPDDITIFFSNVSSVSCFGVTQNCDGAATALASGGGAGAGVYNFEWSSGEVETGVVNSTAVMLCQGQQFVTVSDANGCASVHDTIIPTPDPLTIMPTFTQPTCFGLSDGSILSTGSGGTGGTSDYMYVWDDNSTNTLLSGIPAGTYSVTITDLNGCMFDTMFVLMEPEILTAIIDPATTNDISCNGNSDGQITVVYEGGNAVDFSDMSYIWSNGASTNQISGLAAGTYTVTISDQNGCTDEISHTVNEPTLIIADIPQPAEPLCFGFQTFMTVDAAFGGDGGPYSFSIDNGPDQDIGTQIPVFAGAHTVMVFDSSGCFYEEEIIINHPPEVIVDLGPDIEIQLGETAQLNAVLGGSVVPIDSIIWTPTDSLSCTGCLNPVVSPIDGTTYTVQIFNTDGCTGSDEIFVDVDKNRNVFIPNAFTPNGDGFNDFFQIFTGPGVSNVNSVIVFDRWGEVVYSAENLSPTPFPDSSNGWDGKMNGRIMNPGVFVYLVEVEFEDKVTLLFRGDVTLMH